MTSLYPITVQDFEGPLDLLLHLIETQKMSITDIKLSQITDQYLSYLRDSLAQQMEVASEFIVMASTLIAIKAKTLLPQQKNDEQSAVLNDEWQEDPEALLREQLIIYRAYKEAATELKHREQTRHEQWNRMPMSLELFRDHPVAADFLAEVTPARLQKIYEAVLERLLADPEVEIYRDQESIPMRMARIERRLLLGPVNFQQLIETNSRREWVTVFLSLLELIHLRKVVFRQERMFSDIWIEKI